MRQLEYVQILYAFHFHSLQRKRARTRVLTTFLGILETWKCRIRHEAKGGRFVCRLAGGKIVIMLAEDHTLQRIKTSVALDAVMRKEVAVRRPV